jgi:8-hydroxy-5-deazaflavin:NADPH oxidoreductase
VIKAFNTILATSLLAKGCPTGTKGRIALPVAGDRPSAKTTVLRLVDELGFNPVDAGTLDESWRQQTGAAARSTARRLRVVPVLRAAQPHSENARPVLCPGNA